MCGELASYVTTAVTTDNRTTVKVVAVSGAKGKVVSKKRGDTEELTIH